MKRVLVSEWARKAAHNLDATRDAWLAKAASSDLDASQLRHARIDVRLDHTATLAGSYGELKQLYQDALWDVNALEAFLSQINANQTIDGQRYAWRAFQVYRSRVIKELAYKKTLCAVAKEGMRFQRIAACDGGNPQLEVVAAVGATNDLALLERLMRIFRLNMKQARGKAWFDELAEPDRKFVDWLMDEIARRRLVDGYPDAANAADEELSA